MSISRRNLIRLTGGALAAPASRIALSPPARARGRGALVLVRSSRGVLAVNPRTGEIHTWGGPFPATPVPGVDSPPPAPGAIATPVTEGAIDYWMVAPGGGAFVFRIDTGASSSWWWRRDGGRSTALDLPRDLEPAFPSGSAARWFHGATIDSAHLGAGALRLFAIDIETGDIVLDHEMDRRLELAATKASREGAVVAHVQSSTAGLAFWAADLRGGTRAFETSVGEEPGLAAASAIALDVVADGDAVLVAAGVAADWSGAPDPTVYTMWAASLDTIGTVSLPGELIGIVPEDDS